uniref:NAC domain-containing protein n=1 Tax=Glycine max TaxID=3847 RepID=C6TBH8_SOYBN|nr:unknown [Glycine max]
MEVLNPIEGKTYKLPVGYRFDPSDEILAGYYLRKRIMAQPLPNDLIQDCDVYQTVPWELPGGGNKYLNWQRFFFHDLRTCVFDNLNKREAGNGQWRTIEEAQDVELSNDQVVAKRNVLAFWEAKGNGFAKFNWLMHEFRLVSKSLPSMVFSVAVYRIFEKKEGRKGKKAKGSEGETSSSSSSEEEVMDEAPIVIDFTMESCIGTGPPSPATSENS